MSPLGRGSLFERSFSVGAEDAVRRPSAQQLALATEPLTFGNKRNTIAFLVHSQIATVAEDDGIGVFTITIITNSTLAILFFSGANSFAIYRSRGTGAWALCLW